MASVKRGPPKHQNSIAWVPSRSDKHNTLRKLVAALPNAGVCDRCHEQIEWKKKYGKYKPLRQPAKCTSCGGRNVEHAYHQICQTCCGEKRVCAKCLTAKPMPGKKSHEEEHPRERVPDASELKEMNERQRRSALRKVEQAKRERKAAEKAARAAAAEGGEDAAGRSGSDDDDADEDETDEDEDEVDIPSKAEAKRTGNIFAAGAAEARARAKQLASDGARARAQKLAFVAESSAPPPPMAPPPPPSEPHDTLPAVPPPVADGRSGPAGPAAGATRAHLADNDDDAAAAAVEAENVTEDEEDEEGEEGGELDENDEEEDDEEDDEDDEDDDEADADDEELREQLQCLSHSAGARALVLQGYGWLQPAKHLAVAEAGFDALCERLTDAGGASATAADAMTDRVAQVAEVADETAMALAMLLELECYARVLPASFDADATALEKAARGLFARRAAPEDAPVALS